MLLAMGRYVLKEKTEEGRKRHYLTKLSNFAHIEKDISHNQFNSWKAAKGARSEEEWIRRLETRSFSDKTMRKIVSFLKKENWVMEIDLKTAKAELLDRIIVSRNGFAYQYSEIDQEGRVLITPKKPKEAIRLSKEEYWVYNSALCNSLSEVIGQLMISLKCGRTEAIEAIERNSGILLSTNLWFFEMLEDETLPVTGIVPKKSRIRRQIGIPLGVTRTSVEEMGAVALGDTVFSHEGTKWYMDWLVGESPKRESVEGYERLFPYYDENCLFMCPQGSFISHKEEQKVFKVAPSLTKEEVVELDFATFLLWNASRTNLSLAQLRILLKAMGFKDRSITRLFREGIQYLCLHGLCLIIKR